MKHLIALAFLVAAPAVAFTPPPADVSGTWAINGDVQGVPVVETCSVVQTEVALTGSCDTSTGKYDLKGKIDGQTFTFSHGGKYEGSDLVITFTGKLAADGSVAGTMDVAPFNASGSFTASKAPAKPPAAS